MNSGFYNFPAWTNAVKGGFRAMNRLAAADKHKPLGKYTILTTIAQKYTTNVGYPGYATAGVDEVFNTFVIPTMFARVVRDEVTPEQAAETAQGEIERIFAKWAKTGSTKG